ncbi:MAG TPA: heme ABC transporter ATP-binding protein [Tepidiformaceae bacterium]|nr:heme ABC transporter ATP-binding protein [Tepidiformaceae bacterium]
MTPLLETRGLTFAIGRARLVRDVTFDVSPGEVLTIVGANGAGKSTLLGLLGGDLKPTSGEVNIAGRPAAKTNPAQLARVRAVLPQRSRIEFAFTVREVVMMGRSPHQKSSTPAEDNAVVETSLARAGVEHLADRSFPTLSGGEQARVCFARVLAQRTPVVLLDEPTAALDIRFQHMVLGEARRLAHEGVAVVAVLHDINLAAAYATRVAVMHRGAMAALGEPEAVLTAETLSEVYSHPVDVIRDPRTGQRLVVPQPALVAAG